MRLAFSDLWHWNGKIDRKTYAAIGISLFILKYLLDCLIAMMFHRSWLPWEYLRPSNTFGLLMIPAEERPFFWVMLMAAIPFVWIGLVQTIKRLRTAQLPYGLFLIFFIPVVNLVLFLLLSTIPFESRVKSTRIPEKSQAVRDISIEQSTDADLESAEGTQVVPLDYAPVTGIIQSKWNMVFAVFLPLLLAVPFTLFGVQLLRSYGWALFVGLPFTIAFTAGCIYGMRSPGKFGGTFGAALLSVTLWGLSLLLFQFEGVMCLIMASPLVYVVAGMGAIISFTIQSVAMNSNDRRKLFGILLPFIPTLMIFEKFTVPTAPVFQTRTAIEIDAPPERVWPHVVDFPDLQPPKEWVFRSGVAYPMRAQIVGRGPGAVRHCVFTTGTFVEPIQEWDPPRLLRFAVTENPPPMREWNPMSSNIHPPHLHGFFVSHQGQFMLTELPGGKTRLEGTTWYEHNMWPSTYWAFWSNFIVHRIHYRVLDHVKMLTEQDERKRRTMQILVEVTSHPQPR